MTDLTCDLTRHLATEYALGILPAADRPGVAAHLTGCAQCRQEIDEIRAIGDRLLDLVPDAEPSVGFERTVIARFGQQGTAPRRRRRSARGRLTMGIGALAACIVAAIVIPLAASSGHQRVPDRLDASLLDSGRSVGSVDVSGRPPWVYMSVQGEPVGGTVRCQLVRRDGVTVTVGSFELLDGRGSWGARVPGAASLYAGARLVDASGRVLAYATF